MEFLSHTICFFFESCRICWLQSYTFNDFVSHGRSKQHLNRSFKINDLDFYRRAAKPKKDLACCSVCNDPVEGVESGKAAKKCFPKAVRRLDPISWTAWSNWSSCAVCGTPTQRRTRTCHRPCPHDTRSCRNDSRGSVDTRACPSRPCPVNCQTVENNPGECNAVCDGSKAEANGTKTVELMVLAQPKNGGQPCPSPLTKEKPCRKRCVRKLKWGGKTSSLL